MSCFFFTLFNDINWCPSEHTNDSSSLLTAAMNLFGLNWHLQPTDREIYEISDDKASSWPLPTDVTLYPSGKTGEGRVCSNCCEFIVRLISHDPSRLCNQSLHMSVVIPHGITGLAQNYTDDFFFCSVFVITVFFLVLLLVLVIVHPNFSAKWWPQTVEETLQQPPFVALFVSNMIFVACVFADHQFSIYLSKFVIKIFMGDAIDPLLQSMLSLRPKTSI